VMPVRRQQRWTAALHPPHPWLPSGSVRARTWRHPSRGRVRGQNPDNGRE
jgi:hypothetical protein